MRNQKWLILSLVLVLIAGTAGALTWLKKHQRLGQPGIKAEPIPGSVAMKIDLPARVLDFTSTNVPESEVELGYFPKDTSYVQRWYMLPDGSPGIQATIILMGADRTSIHRPDYCLPGQGWSILEKTEDKVPIEGPQPYLLRVMKWRVANSTRTPDGRKAEVHGVYVFWFAADGEQTPSHDLVKTRLVLNLLYTGTLQRWAYISYFSACTPGQEEATFARMKQLIAASVPEFQLPPKPEKPAPAR
jgi:hypothetical protein